MKEVLSLLTFGIRAFLAQTGSTAFRSKFKKNYPKFQ
jgi:hypothetical protein